jgi:uncharacterized protein DUF4383
MTDRKIIMMIGVAFLAIGLLGFIPAFVQPASQATPDLVSSPGYGYLLGLFPVNLWHNLVHVAFGIWGLSASRTAFTAGLFARRLAVIYGVLAVMGLIPGLNTTFGLVPLFGHDIWLHALIAATAAYVGFGRRSESVTIQQSLRRRAG